MEGVGCSVVEWVKRSTLRWFGYVQKMDNEEFAKVYLSSVEGPRRRGRPLGRWEDRMKEYKSEGKCLKQARRKCMDRGRGRSFSCG